MARKRHKKHRWNPGVSVGGTLGAVKTGFQPKTLISYAPVALGGLLNIYASDMIANRLPAGWQVGWKRILVNVASAGVLGGVTAMISKKYASKVFVGGMLQAAVAGLTPYVGPQVDKMVNIVAPLPAPAPVAAAAPATVKGMLGMDDFLDTGTPRLGAMDELGCCSGTGEPEEADEMTV